MGILDLVDAVYLINMDSATDRLAAMARQCAQHGIPFTRVPAVDGRKVKPKAMRAMVDPSCRTGCTPSMIGCALSHMRVWKEALRAGHERVLVLEDDAKLVPDFVPRLAQGLEDVPPDFDVLLCGCMFLCNKKREYSMLHGVGGTLLPLMYPKRTDKRTWGSVFVPEFFGGTHCYVVSSKGCRTLGRVIPRAKYHVDVCMNHPDVALYAVSPDLALQGAMADSSMASFDFPKTLVPMLTSVKDDKEVPYAYYLNVPWGQQAGVVLNAWMWIFFGLGLAHRWVAPYVAGVFLAELIVGGRVGPPVLAFACGWALESGARAAYRRVRA